VAKDMALVLFHQIVFVPTVASFQLCKICIAIDLCLFVVAQLQPQMAYDNILLVQVCIQITLKTYKNIHVAMKF
jgi:hypothetical protein